MVALVRRTNGLLFRQGGLLVRATETSLAAYQDCCCPEDDGDGDDADCCAPGLPTNLCATVTTHDDGFPELYCLAGTGGTVDFDLAQAYTNVAGTVRVWQGAEPHCPTDCETWRLQIAAECDEATGNVKWFICQDSCTLTDFYCDVDPPDLADTGIWTPAGETDGTPCLLATYTGAPLSSCGTAGDYDCVFTITLSEGTC